jgi:hypothetical protein
VGGLPECTNERPVRAEAAHAGLDITPDLVEGSVVAGEWVGLGTGDLIDGAVAVRRPSVEEGLEILVI